MSDLRFLLDFFLVAFVVSTIAALLLLLVAGIVMLWERFWDE